MGGSCEHCMAVAFMVGDSGIETAAAACANCIVAGSLVFGAPKPAQVISLHRTKRNRQQKARARKTHQRQVSWNGKTSKQAALIRFVLQITERLQHTGGVESVSLALEVAINEMASDVSGKRREMRCFERRCSRRDQGNFLQKFDELDSVCLTKLQTLAPDISHFQPSNDASKSSSMSDSNKRKAKAHERQAAIVGNKNEGHHQSPLSNILGGKSALVFCQTGREHQVLAQTAMNHDYSNPFIKSSEQQERLREASLSCEDKQIQSYILYGVHYNGSNITLSQSQGGIGYKLAKFGHRLSEKKGLIAFSVIKEVKGEGKQQVLITAAEGKSKEDASGASLVEREDIKAGGFDSVRFADNGETSTQGVLNQLVWRWKLHSTRWLRMCPGKVEKRDVSKEGVQDVTGVP
ncbi:hypothetical protein Tco_0031781 [Tanacetum coccineum]